MRNFVPALVFLLLGITSSHYVQAAMLAAPVHDCGEHQCMVTRNSVTARGGGSSGKWRDDVTPKRGWVVDDLEDLGRGNSETCEMCEREEVRYIHILSHVHSETLRVGCICAAYMEGALDTKEDLDSNLKRADRRKRDAVNLARRQERALEREAAAQVQAEHERQERIRQRRVLRAAFPSHKDWKIARNGSPYIRYNGHMIFLNKGRYGGKYSSTIDNVKTGQWLPLHRAKLLVFDMVYPEI